VHNNYYFLRQISQALSERITGWELSVCFSQEKDELVLGFTDSEGEFYIKAVLHPTLACLVFPRDFQRARKNSVDLFGEITGLRVTKVVQYLNERSFALVFEQDYTLLFKMHGNRSNLILFQGENVVALFHNNLSSDLNLHPDTLYRPIDQSYEAFIQAGRKVEKLFPTFGKVLKQYLHEKNYDRSLTEMQWPIIRALLKELEHPKYYVTRLRGEPILSLVRIGEVLRETADPLEATNEFYGQYTRLSSLEAEKNAALRTLAKKKQRTENYLLKNYEKLEELQQGARNEQTAHILMANLHQIPARSESVELYDFYRDQPIRIKLKPDLSAQKNAEVYYRKAKNEKIEIAKLSENIAAKERELKKTEVHVQAVVSMEGLKELRKYMKANGLTFEPVKETPASLFRKLDYMDFEIWIGKNAKNNDLLTQKYAFKEDLWLHARDVSGSHVLIKYRAGKNFPQQVIERAAQLAAYHSKRRTDSLCPVIVTPKKFVRKPKGLPEGAVVLDKEEVIMVVPEPWTEEPEIEKPEKGA
jgi:predicted ribosome quality control (RQC) complex YloA/Tae2 family protein